MKKLINMNILHVNIITLVLILPSNQIRMIEPAKFTNDPFRIIEYYILIIKLQGEKKMKGNEENEKQPSKSNGFAEKMSTTY